MSDGSNEELVVLMPASVPVRTIHGSHRLVDERASLRMLGFFLPASQRLAFEVDSVEDCKRHLESLGTAVEAVRVDEHTGRKFVFFADPDGLPLELYEASSA